MRVLAIDPGLTRCGVGVIESKSMSLIGVGVLKSSADDAIEQRLMSIDAQIREWIILHQPDVIAIERVFSQQNLRTVMGLSLIHI